MGFINATYELGKLASSKMIDPEFADIGSYLQLPMPIIEDEEKSGRVIRIWLNVTDNEAECLEVKNIEKIDISDYIKTTDQDKLNKMKKNLIYREPTGAATPWKFSPIYKLGKGSTTSLSDLIGTKESWEKESKSRFYKLNKTVLSDYETCHFLSEGSASLIMAELEENVGRLSELWSDKKRSYIMVFGVNHNGNFLYPGEIPAFRAYFRIKLSESIGGTTPIICSLCHKISQTGVNLDKIFKFATFDKTSFLPGIKNGEGICEKVFPICDNCISMLSLGRDTLDRLFLDSRTIPGVNIYVVPELLFDQDLLHNTSSQTRDFIRNGLKTTKRLFNILAKQENSLVYHFLFWEKNQAQERLHLMIEDVPPSRLKSLEKLWQETYKTFLWNQRKNPEPNFITSTIDLDDALKTIFFTLISLSGKNDSDKNVIRSQIISIIGKLLGGEKIDAHGIKQLMVSRFTGLFANPEWIKFGNIELRKMIAITEFINKTNRR